MIKQFYFKQFNLVCHLLTHSLTVKQLYLIHRLNPIRCYHSGWEWTWEQWQWKGIPRSPKFLHHWNLTIRLFNFISRTLVGMGWGGILSLCRNAVGVFCSPNWLGWHQCWPTKKKKKKKTPKNLHTSALDGHWKPSRSTRRNGWDGRMQTETDRDRDSQKRLCY